ncbi:hypothetical protein AB1484_35030, partial [Parafrankia sp. FMc6]
EARQDLWSARCGESRTPGAGSGPEKRTGRKTSTALRADFHLAHLTGPGGHVTTIDIDPDVTSGASTALAAAGVEDVTVITGDGVFGDPDGHVHDRLIATVGVWDISSAWWDQLTPGGRLVLPLRWRGQTQAVAFRRDGNRMISETVELCGFVPMIGQEGERTAPIHPGVALAPCTGIRTRPSTPTPLPAYSPGSGRSPCPASRSDPTTPSTGSGCA